MYSTMVKSTLTLILLITISGHAHEADSVLNELLDMSIEELGNIEVVTASKILRSAADITQKVDILNEQQISSIISSNRNIAEYIQYIPGASVTVLSRNDANWGSYGGIGPKYSTYMVQGLPVDAFIDPMNIEIMAVERIEIQRGPASVLYPNLLSQDFAGNQCPLAGTVNLIIKENIKKPKTMLSAAFGSFETYTGQLYHENRFGRLHFTGGVSAEQSEYTEYGSNGSWLNMVHDPAYKKGKAFVNAKVYFDEEKNHSISAFGHQTVHWGDFGRENRGYENKYSLLNTGYSGWLNKRLKLSVKTGIRWYDRMWEEDNYSTEVQDFTLRETVGVQQLIFPADISLSFSHFNNSNATIGADYQLTSYRTVKQPVGMDEKIGNKAAADQFGVYAQEELQLGKLILRGGGRFNVIGYDIDKSIGEIPDTNEQRWRVPLWSAGAKYRFTDDIVLYANAGNSLLPPGIKSICGTLQSHDEKVVGRNGQLPNPDLEEEDGFGADIGLDCLLPFHAHSSLRFFYTFVTDAIIDNVVSHNPSQTISVNTDGKTRVNGFELCIKQQIRQRIEWFANATYTRSIIEAPENADQDGVEIPFVPKAMANAGFTVYLPFDVAVIPRIHFTGRIYDSSSKKDRTAHDIHELISMMITKRNILIKDNADSHLDLFVEFANITNNTYKMPWQFQDPGLNLRCGVRVVF